MSISTPWTDDRVDVLTRLWCDGQSASAIARMLGGTTRNAVIGKVHRLGLSGRRAPSAPGARRARRVKVETRLRLPAPPQPVALRAVAAASRPLAVEPPMVGLTDMANVGRHACRWPLGDPRERGFSLCGRPAERGAYCGVHGRLAYRPTARDHLLKLAGLA